MIWDAPCSGLRAPMLLSRWLSESLISHNYTSANRFLKENHISKQVPACAKVTLWCRKVIPNTLPKIQLIWSSYVCRLLSFFTPPHRYCSLSLFLFITHYTRLARSKVWGSGRLSSRPEALASPATTHSTCNVSCRRRARLRTFSSAFGLKGTTLSLIGRQPTFIRNRATLRIAFGESWDVLQHEGQTVSMTDATHTGRSVTWHYKSLFLFFLMLNTNNFPPLQVHQCIGRWQVCPKYSENLGAWNTRPESSTPITQTQDKQL